MELVAVMRSAFLISFNSKQNVFVIVACLFEKAIILFLKYCYDGIGVSTELS